MLIDGLRTNTDHWRKYGATNSNRSTETMQTVKIKDISFYKSVYFVIFLLRIQGIKKHIRMFYLTLSEKHGITKHIKMFYLTNMFWMNVFKLYRKLYKIIF